MHEVNVRVPTNARRSVIFIGIMKDNSFRPKATGFLVCTTTEDFQFQAPYIVTAEHVVSGLISKGFDLYCRLNMKDGTVLIEKLPSYLWWFHPNQENIRIDVAVIRFNFDQNILDHDYIPLPLGPIQRHWKSFGLGDEIFVIGLFINHFGKKRNIPIVRIGTIAAMAEEPISTDSYGQMDAYLIEVRSIAGLSGSPVFLNVQALSSDPADHPSSMYEFEMREQPRTGPSWQTPKYGIERKIKTFPRDKERLSWFRYRFCGLVHGHFDVPNLVENVVVDDLTGSGINTGIGVVVPAEKVLETLYQPGLVAEREAQFVESLPSQETHDGGNVED